MKALVVAPTRREASALTGVRGVFVCGSGERSGDALRSKIEAERPGLVLVAGVCGALDPSLKPGALILGRRVLMEGRDDLVPGEIAVDRVRKALRRRRLRFVYAGLLTVAAPAATGAAKTGLWNTFGAGGADMETYWLALAASEAGVPWLTIRSVVDTAGQSLPVSLRSWDQEEDVCAILARAALRPGEWPGYLRLARQWRRAARSLRGGTRLAVATLDQLNDLQTLPEQQGGSRAS